MPGQHAAEPENEAVSDRDINEGAGTRPLCLPQPGQDAGRRQRPRDYIAPGRAAGEVLVLAARIRLQISADRLIVDVVAGQITVGAVLAVAGDRAVDDLGIELPNGVVGQLQPLHHAWPESFHQYVAALGKLVCGRVGVRVLEVERDAFLAEARKTEQPRIRSPLRIAARGPLQLDDLRAEISQQPSAEWARELLGQRQHGDALKSAAQIHCSYFLPRLPDRPAHLLSRESSNLS